MLNIGFLTCTKVELWDLIVCIVVHGEKFQSRAVTLNLVGNAQYRTCPRYFHILQSSPISCTQINYFLSYLAKHTHTHPDLWK